MLLQPGPGDPRAHQHGPGGAGVSDSGAGTGGTHLPVLRPGLSLHQGGAGGPAGQDVKENGARRTSSAPRLGKKKAAVSSGASTPTYLTNQVIDFLKQFDESNSQTFDKQPIDFTKILD